jgi:hypothetical protein
MKNAKHIIAASLALASFSAASAFAETGTAHVNILQALSLNETQTVEFNDVVNQDGSCTMAAGGALSGDNCVSDSGTPGQFTITGTASKSVDIAVTAGSAVDGVTFTPVIEGGASSLALTGGADAVNIIGDVTLSGATDGAKNIAYTFTANYQ